MKILFLDTSNADFVVGIIDSNQLIYEKQIELVKEHSKYAMAEIEKAFKETNLEPKDIDKIMVVNGPGSYTGVRIGVTIAKTYAWALKKEIIGISSLKAMAISTQGDNNFIIPIIDARRESVFGAIYDQKLNCILEEQYLSVEKLKSIIFDLTGEKLLVNVGHFFYEEEFKKINRKKIKLDVLKVVNFCQNDTSINPHKLNPVYLKRTEAEENIC